VNVTVTQLVSLTTSKIAAVPDPYIVPFRHCSHVFDG
jgi:hypothetical protein